MLYIIAKGIKDDEIKNVKLRIDLKNTMDITAYSAASVILAVLERNDDIGIYWANDILSENIMDDYRKNVKKKAYTAVGSLMKNMRYDKRKMKNELVCIL